MAVAAAKNVNYLLWPVSLRPLGGRRWSCRLLISKLLIPAPPGTVSECPWARRWTPNCSWLYTITMLTRVECLELLMDKKGATHIHLSSHWNKSKIHDLSRVFLNCIKRKIIKDEDCSRKLGKHFKYLVQGQTVPQIQAAPNFTNS